MEKKLIAVSGGVDSVVLLHFLSKKFDPKDLIVAHFEHGIRKEDSLSDMEFVRKLADQYDIKFEFDRGHLGENASESQARDARYKFLRKISEKYSGAKIFTAHHKNDLAETFVLNLARGGGWRAIACFDSKDIERPFLRFSKKEIIEMAKDNNLDWREDLSNLDQKYTRNKIRSSILFSPSDLDKIFEIWNKQIEIRREIEDLTKDIINKIKHSNRFERNFFQEESDEVCHEILRQILWDQSGRVPLNKQIRDFLHKIRTYKNRSRTQILGGKNVRFSRDFFEFENFIEK